jgi:hypothetical protein
MMCPNCKTTLQYHGGANKEDFGCPNGRCPSKMQIMHHIHVRIRDNWWFAPEYHIPFKYCDDWFTVSGPVATFYDDLSGDFIPHDTIS